MRLEIISKYPVKDQHATPLLFIHGALHGAWCWDVGGFTIQRYLEDHFAPAAVLLSSPSPAGLSSAAFKTAPPRTPRATASAYHTQAQVVPDVAHNSMLEQQWQTVAD
jgi:hypothetical protein